MLMIQFGLVGFSLPKYNRVVHYGGEHCTNAKVLRIKLGLVSFTWGNRATSEALVRASRMGLQDLLWLTKHQEVIRMKERKERKRARKQAEDSMRGQLEMWRESSIDKNGKLIECQQRVRELETTVRVLSGQEGQ